jgi:uncharacterized protein
MRSDASTAALFPSQPIAQLLVKVASRCNIDCSYCYWFRDAAVYDKPKLMSAEVLDQLLRRTEEHIGKYALTEFPIILHGGEPMLWGIENFNRIAKGCADISHRTRCEIPIGVTTNGILVDEAWLDCLESNGISVAISLDGPAHVHDARRRTFQGAGTHATVERAARMLLSRNIGVSALAVCDPAVDPQEYVGFFAGCGIESYDIMIPDATVDETPPRIVAFYKRLFDLWFAANRHQRTTEIRIVTDMVAALLGVDAPTEGVGYRAVELCTIMTDGTIEAHDVLRIAGNGSSVTACNIFDHAIDDIRNEPHWQAARAASIDISDKCRRCKFMNACGGGYLPHRFSKRNGYDNPSVYCDDLYATFEHIQATLAEQVYLRRPDGERVAVIRG